MYLHDRKIFRQIACAALSVIAVLTVSGCFLFGGNYEPGEQMPGGEWYAEHDYDLGDRTVQGIMDDSDIEWPEPYMNGFHFSLTRKYYDDTPDEDLLESVRDENDFLRMVCDEEENTFKISGLPSWDGNADSYVIGEIVNYGDNFDGGLEGYRLSRSSTDLGESLVYDIGTFTLRPINGDYSITFNLKYMYKGSGSSYTEKTYQELTDLGFELVNGNNSFVIAEGYGDDNQGARIVQELLDDMIQAQQVTVTNAFAGGTYRVEGGFMVNGEGKGFPNSGIMTVTLGDSNPNPSVTGTIYID